MNSATTLERSASGETATPTILYGQSVYRIGALLVAAICLCFVALWWNRYLAVTNEGWHFMFGLQILQGKVPYRDFYLYVPPLLQIEIASTIRMFGTHLLMSQVVGVVEISIMSLVLYWWMARLYSPTDAFLSTLLAMLLFLADFTEELDALHTPAAFYTVLAGAAASLVLTRKQLQIPLVVLTGIFAGLSFLAKQTSGVASVLSLLVLLPLLAHWLYGRKAGVFAFLAFLGGLAIPLTLVTLWLQRAGALGAAVSDVFVRGPSSKGSFRELLVRPAHTLWAGLYLRQHLVLTVLLFAAFLLIWRFRDLSRLLKDPSEKKYLWWLGAAAFASLAAGWLLSRLFPFHLPGALVYLPRDVAALLGELGSLFFFLYYFSHLVTQRIENHEAQFLLTSGFSFAVAFMVSLSAPVYVNMMVPALAFVLGAMLTGLRSAPGAKLLRLAAAAACCLVVVHVVWLKCDVPYSWSGWKEPNIRRASARVPYPELRGYRMSPTTAQFVTRVTEDIKAHSTPDQPVFVYPDLTLFYILSHRQPATFAYVHYIDVAPDFVDVADAQTLRTRPPAVIVEMKASEEELRLSEVNFRGGRRSGQRDMVAALDAIRPMYQLIDTLTVPGSGKTVEVLALQGTPADATAPQ